MSSGSLLRGILSGLVAVLTVAVVGAGVFAWDRLEGRAEGASRVTAGPVGPSVAPGAGGAQPACGRAQPSLFDALSAHLARDGRSFGGPQYTVDGDGGLAYVSAPLRDAAGVVRVAAPVWVYGGSGYAWLTESAHRVTPDLPDARRLYAADPSGPAATRLASCVTGSARSTPTR